MPLATTLSDCLTILRGGRSSELCLPIPIDTDFFSPAPHKRVDGRIGFSGRLDDPRKNLQLLLRALSHLRQAGHRLSALLIGGEPDERLRRLIRELGLGDAVEFTGYLSIETLRDKLRTLDLFVVPSHQEGLCIAALEAMACGCPVVSTRCGGPEEFVLDDETGFLVEASIRPRWLMLFSVFSVPQSCGSDWVQLRVRK